LIPEQWGSLLVQEKYQAEMACDTGQQQQQQQQQHNNNNNNNNKFPKLHIRPPSLILLMIHPRIGEYFPAKAEK
jgi:hypothetical protein